MFFILNYSRKGFLKAAVTMAKAREIRDAIGSNGSIIEAASLKELKAKAPLYFKAIAEAIESAPVPLPVTVDKKRFDRIYSRKKELFEHVDRGVKRRIFYDFKARMAENERKAQQAEFEKREQRKREREAAAKALLVAEQTNSKSGSNHNVD